MRLIVKNLGYEPIVPPKSNRLHKWEYDRELYKRRNETLDFFVACFRRIFTRYDKLDMVYAGIVLFVMIIDSVVLTRPRN